VRRCEVAGGEIVMCVLVNTMQSAKPGFRRTLSRHLHTHMAPAYVIRRERGKKGLVKRWFGENQENDRTYRKRDQKEHRQLDSSWYLEEEEDEGGGGGKVEEEQAFLEQDGIRLSARNNGAASARKRT